MLLIKGHVAAAMLLCLAVSSSPGQDVPALSRVEVEYRADLDDPLCAAARATVELSFPDGSGVSSDMNAAVTVDLTTTGADKSIPSENGLVWVQPAEPGADGSAIRLYISLDASSLPGGVFGEFLDLSVSLAASISGEDACAYPGPAAVRMGTSCYFPPGVGDIYRIGERVRFIVLEISPPICGNIPIPVESRSWGSVKAMYR